MCNGAFGTSHVYRVSGIMHRCNISIISIGLSCLSFHLLDSVVQWLRRPFDHLQLEMLDLSSIPNEGNFISSLLFLCCSFFLFFFFSFLLFLLF